jgi:hypothetical protein
MHREAEVAIDSLGEDIDRREKADHQRQDENPKDTLHIHCRSFLVGFEIDIMACVNHACDSSTNQKARQTDELSQRIQPAVNA